MATRLSQEREEAIIAAYDEWDPSASPIDELAERAGVARQTVYAVLRRHNIPLKSERPAAAPDEGAAVLRGMETALEQVLARYEACLLEVQLLRDLVRELRRGEEGLSRSQRELLDRLT
jgi:hypothetical protein